MTHPLTGGYDDLRIATATVAARGFRPVDEQFLHSFAIFLVHYKQPKKALSNYRSHIEHVNSFKTLNGNTTVQNFPTDLLSSAQPQVKAKTVIRTKNIL